MFLRLAFSIPLKLFTLLCKFDDETFSTQGLSFKLIRVRGIVFILFQVKNLYTITFFRWVNTVVKCLTAFYCYKIVNYLIGIQLLEWLFELNCLKVRMLYIDCSTKVLIIGNYILVGYPYSPPHEKFTQEVTRYKGDNSHNNEY